MVKVLKSGPDYTERVVSNLPDPPPPPPIRKIREGIGPVIDKMVKREMKLFLTIIVLLGLLLSSWAFFLLYLMGI